MHCVSRSRGSRRCGRPVSLLPGAQTLQSHISGTSPPTSDMTFETDVRVRERMPRAQTDADTGSENRKADRGRARQGRCGKEGGQVGGMHMRLWQRSWCVTTDGSHRF